MKKINVLKFVSSSILTLGLLAGCNTPEQKVENAEQKVSDAKANVIEAKENLQQARIDSASEYRKFKADAETRLIANEKEIAALRTHKAEEKKELQAKYDKKLEDLEQKNAKLKNQMDNYKDENQKDKWDSFKLSFNEEMTKIEEELKGLTKKKM
jgi:uncharacterized protein YciW